MRRQAALPSDAMPIIPLAILVGCAVSASISERNGELWLLAGCALALSVQIIGFGAASGLVAIVGVLWFAIAADLLSADTTGTWIGDSAGGDYRSYVIVLALLALFVIACSAKWGLHLSAGRRRPPASLGGTPLNLQRCLWLYVGTTVGKVILFEVAYTVPPLIQPLLGFAKLHFVSVFLVSYCVFRNSRGYGILALIFLWEAMIGTSGFISTFQPVVVTIFVALLMSLDRSRLAANAVRLCIVAGAALWLATTWTAMKPSYREWVNGGSGEQVVTRSFSERIGWITSWVIDGPKAEDKTHPDAFAALLQRMGYTAFFALAAERADQGMLNDVPPRWQGAVTAVLMPRILFFDKPALDDTAVTTALTGMTFSRTTSVSVGFMAEAYVDFGFPGMFLPLSLLGLALGGTTGFFLTRGMRPELGRAFAVAATTFTFQFGGNVDKEIGGFMTGLIALALARRLIADRLEAWVCSPVSRKVEANVTARA